MSGVKIDMEHASGHRDLRQEQSSPAPVGDRTIRGGKGSGRLMCWIAAARYSPESVGSAETDDLCARRP